MEGCGSPCLMQRHGLHGKGISAGLARPFSSVHFPSNHQVQCAGNGKVKEKGLGG